MNKRPLVTAGLLILAGEISCLAGRNNFIYTAAITAATILILIISSRTCNLKNCNVLLLFCCLAAGLALGRVSLYLRTSTELLYGETVTLSGKITDTWGRRLRIQNDTWGRGLIIQNDTWGHSSEVLTGRYVEVTGVLEKPDESTNPGGFDISGYYSGMNIEGVIYAEEIRFTGKCDGLMYGLATLRAQMKDALYMYFSEERASFLAALLLGEKSGLDNELKQLYRRNGLAHLLAISGMHIAILAGALDELLKRLGMGRKLRGGFVLALAILYGIMTGFAASTVRVVVMLAMRYIALVFGRSNDIPTDMMTAILVISIINPWSVFTAGTQLSFVATAGIHISNRIFADYFGWRRVIRGFGPRQKDNSAVERFDRWFEMHRQALLGRPVIGKLAKKADKDARTKIRNKIMRTLISTVVIELMTVPLLIYYYYEMYPYGMLMGLIILPTVSLLLTGGFTVALAGLLMMSLNLPDSFGNVFRPVVFLTDRLMAFYESVCRLGLWLPFSSINPGHTSVLMTAGCLGLLLIIVVLLLWNDRRGEKKVKFWKARRAGSAARGLKPGVRILLGLVSAVVVVIGFIWTTGLHNATEQRVVLLDVGQGQAALIHLPGKGNYLVDGGSTSKQNVGENIIIPALKYYGMSDVKAVFISHTDSDHISGIIEMAEVAYLYRIEIESVCMAFPTEDGENYKLLEEALGDIPIVKGLSAGDVVDGCVTVIYPTAESLTTGVGEDGELDENDRCMVVKAAGVLFPGDISAEIEQMIVADAAAGRIPDISADTLVVSHHGSRFSSDPEFLRAVGAKTAVISCGRNNIYGHPAPQTIDRLRESGMTIYRTDQDGAILTPGDGG